VRFSVEKRTRSWADASVDVTQLFSLREHAIAKEPGSSYFSLGVFE
jgi:hypothetical protein